LPKPNKVRTPGEGKTMEDMGDGKGTFPVVPVGLLAGSKIRDNYK
jgi:hypothetical protein